MKLRKISTIILFVISIFDSSTAQKVENANENQLLSIQRLLTFQFNCRHLHLCESLQRQQDKNEANSSRLTIKLGPRMDLNSYQVTYSEFNCIYQSSIESNVTIANFTELNEQCYLNLIDVFYAPRDYCIIRFIDEQSKNELMEEPSWTATVLTCTKIYIVNKCCGLKQKFDPNNLNIAEERTRSKGSCRPLALDQSQNQSHNQNKLNYFYIPHVENTSFVLSFRMHVYRDLVSNFELRNSSKIENSRGNFYVRETSINLKRPLGVFLRGRFFDLTENYCVELLQQSSEQSPRIMLFYDKSPEIMAQSFATIIGSIWLCAAPLAFMSAVANFVVLQRNLGGLIVSVFFVCFGFTAILASIIILSTTNMDVNMNNDCTFLDFAHKFAYSSTSIWLAIVNFDLWWNFRKLRNISSDLKQDIFRFTLYFIFGSGGAGLVVLSTWLIGHSLEAKTNASEDTLISYCILYSMPALISLSSVIVALVVSNTVFLIITWRNIQEYQQSTKRALCRNLNKSSSTASISTSIRLYTKLFLVSGPNHLFQIAILFSHLNYSFLSPVGAILEFVFILPNFVLFLLIVCHPNFNSKFVKVFPYFKEFSCCKKYSDLETEKISPDPKRRKLYDPQLAISSLQD